MQLLDYAGFKFWAPVLINDQDSYKAAAKIASNGEVSYSGLLDFLETHEDDLKLFPVGNDLIPMGNNHKVFLWHSPKYWEKPDFMVGQVFESYEKPEEPGKPYVRFRGIIGGDKFQGVVRYRKKCCGEDDKSMSAYVTAFGQNGRVHVVGDGLGTKERFQQLLHPSRNQDAIMFSTHQVQHILDHAKNISCIHDHSNDLPKVRALMPAPSL